MQKVKFQIKGINCNSCATLIEEKLKELGGIIKTRVNFESKKAVIVYDEQKTNEKEIKKFIEGIGEYKIVNENGERSSENNFKSQNMSKNNFFLPISIIIAALIVAGTIVVSNRNSKISQENIVNKGTTQPSANNNSQPLPPERERIVQFEITQDDHVRGDFNAPITLVEFSDFECPFCVRHYPTLKKILNDYKGKVRLVYKHFPLGFHPNAQKAAEASECASEQGKFWEYHDKLFENQPNGYSLGKFKQWAKDLGLNMNKFNDCLDSGKYAQKVQADYQEGLQKNVQGTPATFINGLLVSGALPYETFKQIIDSLLNL